MEESDSAWSLCEPHQQGPFALKFEQTLAIACGIPKADSANSEYSANSGEYSAIQGATPGLTIIFR